MALRAGHGTGAGQPRIEVLPVDELPVGVPEGAGPEQPTDRGPDGRFARGNSLARRGGRSKAGRTRLASQLGLTRLAEQDGFAPYRRSADAFARAQRAALAASVGGGVCGPGPSSMVASAALQLAASRYLSDRAALEGDADLFTKASRLADASRQNLLAAWEMASREGKARRTAERRQQRAQLAQRSKHR